MANHHAARAGIDGLIAAVEQTLVSLGDRTGSTVSSIKRAMGANEETALFIGAWWLAVPHGG